MGVLSLHTAKREAAAQGERKVHVFSRYINPFGAKGEAFQTEKALTGSLKAQRADGMPAREELRAAGWGIVRGERS